MEIPGLKTIHENERDYIISVLKKCNGKIWGEGGAAQLLKSSAYYAEVEDDKAGEFRRGGFSVR